MFELEQKERYHPCVKRCAFALKKSPQGNLQLPEMSSRQARIQEDTHFRIMRILEQNPDVTQRELARELGISVSGLNYCLKALIEKGLVKIKNFADSKNKFGYAYVLTPRGISEKTSLTKRFLERKLAEYEALKKEIAVLKKEEQASRPENHPA